MYKMILFYARIRTLCSLFIQENGQNRKYPVAIDLDYTYGQNDYGKKLTNKQFKYLYKLYKKDFEQFMKYHNQEFYILLMLSHSFSYWECTKMNIKNPKINNWWCKTCSLVRLEIDYKYDKKWITVSYGSGYKY